MLRTLLTFKLGTIKKFFEEKSAAKIITTILFFLVFAFVISGIHFFLVTGLRFSLYQMTAETKNALIAFLYESFYLTLTLLTAVSAVITIIFSLFRIRQDSWIIASPAYKIYPRIAAMKLFFGTLLPLLVLFTPLVLALSKVVRITPYTALSLYTSFTLLIFITTYTLSSLILYIGTITQKINILITKRNLTFFSFVTFTLSFGAALFIYGATSLRHIDLTQLFHVDTSAEALKASDVGKYFLWSPSHITSTQALCSTVKDETCSGSSPLLSLVFMSTVSYLVFIHASKKHFTLWKIFQDARPTSRLNHKKSSYFSKSSAHALFEREYLGITRDLKSFFWILFLIALWVTEVIVHSIAKYTYTKHGISFEEFLPRITSTQAMITLYFISAFTLRFVYPSFTAEKKMRWIIETAPLSIQKRYFTKLTFFTTLFISLGSLINIFAASSLSFSLQSSVRSLAIIIPATLLIVSFGLFLGVFFTSKDGEDAESATTSIPGLFFTGLSLLYGALGTYILFVAEKSKNVGSISLYTACSLVLSLLFIAYTAHKLRHVKNQ